MQSPGYRQITVIQATAILISTIIGVGVLPLPLFGVRAADTGAPLVTLSGILLGLFGLLLITLLGIRFPENTIMVYSEKIIGQWMARIGGVMIVAFFLILTALAAREFGAVVVTSVLRKTPLEVTVLVMLLLAAASTRKDIRTFSYIHLFYTPFILAPGLIIVALSLKNANLVYLQPVTGNEPLGMMRGVLTVASLFQGSFIMTLVIPHMKKPAKAISASLWGMAIAGGLYLLIVIATIAVFGSEETKMLLWPTLELAKTTSLPANILERLDAAFLAVWVTAVFTTLFSSFYLTVHTISQLFRFQDHKMFSFFLLPYVVVLAMLPQNLFQLYQVIEWVGRIGLWITIAYPALLLAVALLRKKRGGCIG